MRSLPLPVLRLKYERSAQAYLRSLPLEHFMESTGQATQRKITLASLELVHAQRPEVQLFNELLIQYPLPDGSIGKVVPDNMVVLWDEPIQADGSYDLPLQPTRPFWVMEYVSKKSERKDEEESFGKYEGPVKVPYYLLYYLDVQELTLYKRRGTKYGSVKPNAQGRYPIKDLELEIGLHDGWARFWFRGQMLPLPGDLLRELETMRQRLADETRRADEQTRRADEQTRRADEQAGLLREEHQARLALEAEVARLRAMVEQQRPRPEDQS